MNGTGAGQIRRILAFALDDALNGSGWFKIDSAFDVALLPSPHADPKLADGASLIGCMPFRGRHIFHRNHFVDTGAHQLYGIGLDTIVAENTAARFGGFVGWGQSRTGGYAPPKGPGTAFFANPNVRNEWIGNRVVEGLRADHQGGPINVTGSFGDKLKTSGNAFTVSTTWAPSFSESCRGQDTWGRISCQAMNRLLVFRRNSVDNNGGFQIGSSIDVLVAGNQVRETPLSSVGLNATQSPFQISAGALGCITHANKYSTMHS